MDGNNSGNPVLPVGSDKELECDLLPLGSADSLAGVWSATVNGELADIVEVDSTSGRAKIRPRTPPGRYPNASSFTVTCLFSTPEGKPIFQFNRTVQVTGK